LNFSDGKFFVCCSITPRNINIEMRMGWSKWLPPELVREDASVSPRIHVRKGQQYLDSIYVSYGQRRLRVPYVVLSVFVYKQDLRAIACLRATMINDEIPCISGNPKAGCHKDEARSQTFLYGAMSEPQKGCGDYAR
jgi:hypothetical protein